MAIEYYMKNLCHPMMVSFIAVSDFESEIIRIRFQAGRESDPPRTILGSSLGRGDSSNEPAEGFVLLVAVDENNLDSRDVGRITIEKNLILVSIDDNNDENGNIIDLHLSKSE